MTWCRNFIRSKIMDLPSAASYLALRKINKITSATTKTGVLPRLLVCTERKILGPRIGGQT